MSRTAGGPISHGRGAEQSEEKSDGGPIGLGTAVLGVISVLVALFLVANPGVTVGRSLDYLPVVVVGAVILLRAGQLGVRRLFDSVTQATVPDVEGRTTVTIPGSDFDQLLDRRNLDFADRIHRTDRITSRLTSVTLDVLSMQDEVGQTPRDALESGSWTDDPVAAAFFERGDDDASLADRLRSITSRARPLSDRTARVVDAVADRMGIDRSGAGAGSGDVTTDNTALSSTGVRRTGRWNGLTALALAAVGVGVLTAQPSLVVVAGMVLALSVFVVTWDEPDADLDVRRTIEPADPAPGEEVTVTVTVENTTGSWALDVRVVDGVPGGLTVESGSPRRGMALRPGVSATYSYTAVASRGHHEFNSASVVVRNPTGTIERSASVAVEGDDAMTYDLRDVSELALPLRKQTSKHVGRVLTDAGGSGIEFHSVREYRTGDPLSRIDWNRAARGRDLATLRFHEERSATVVLVIDAREAAYVAPTAGAPSAVDMSVLGASALVPELIGADDRVGLASLSPRHCWLEPGAGSKHLTRARDLLAADDAFAPHPPSREFVHRIRIPAMHKRLPPEAQLVVFTPLCDEQIVTVLRELRAYGYPITVVSPAVTNTATQGQTLGTIERTLRLTRLRRSEVRVVDWDPADPLAVAVDRARRGWSGWA